MMQLYVWTNDCGRREVRHKQPRRYMCAYTFEQMMEYAREELEWDLLTDYKEEDITGFEIHNYKEQWVEYIDRK